jgi:hypothetical protein
MLTGFRAAGCLPTGCLCCEQWNMPGRGQLVARYPSRPGNFSETQACCRLTLANRRHLELEYLPIYFNALLTMLDYSTVVAGRGPPPIKFHILT